MSAKIPLSLSGFNSPYNCDPYNLSGNKDCMLSLIGLIRCAVTAGHSSLGSVVKGGFFKAIQCAAVIQSNVTRDGGYLKLNDNFRQLDTTEKGYVSYLLAQALCKAFAEKEIKIPWLAHYGKTSLKVTRAKNFKTGIHIAPETRFRPDFIGIDKSGEYHIFEAKGNSGGFDKTTFDHSIEQVSIVKSIGGKSPATRVACFFVLKESFRGVIEDPFIDQEGVCLDEVNAEKILQGHYSFFTGNDFRTGDNISPYNDFLAVHLFDNLYYGVHKKVKELLNRQNINLNDFFMAFSEMRNEQENEEYSIGSDGIILFKK